jgi:hypothetical protein
VVDVLRVASIMNACPAVCDQSVSVACTIGLPLVASSSRPEIVSRCPYRTKRGALAVSTVGSTPAGDGVLDVGVGVGVLDTGGGGVDDDTGGGGGADDEVGGGGGVDDDGAGAIGVTVADGSEYAPVPAALTAATRRTYPVPFVNPVTVNAVVVDPVAIGSDQVVPPLVESSTR